MLEPCEFIVFTDHSRVQAKAQERLSSLSKASGLYRPVQEGNPTMLSSVETVRVPIDYEALTRAQRSNSEVRQFLQNETGPQLELSRHLQSKRSAIHHARILKSRIQVCIWTIISGITLHRQEHYGAVLLA